MVMICLRMVSRTCLSQGGGGEGGLGLWFGGWCVFVCVCLRVSVCVCVLHVCM